MKHILCALFCIVSFAVCLGQSYLGNNFYFVEFVDKVGTGYSIDNPSEYLSQRAIERRVRCNLNIDESDLPVNEQYVKEVENTGAVIWGRSKWRNGVVVKVIENGEMTIHDWIAKISTLKCVTPGFKSPYFSFSLRANHSPSIMKFESNYGNSLRQIQQINCDYLHDSGHKGRGMVIAVLDAGFFKANTQPLLKPLWDNEQILGVQDIVNPFDSDVFMEDGHGTAVLSFMGANVEGQLIGSAPEAKYWLIRTEDNTAGVDNLSEEYFWLIGAEMADSVGADIINSSLGYNYFVEEYMSYSYEDMNGKTAVSTLAAEKAIEKGMLVVCSAGNEGSKAWRYITAPADGENVLTVGAVNLDGNIASFSSVGPSADGRIKPDVVAGGQDVYYANPDYETDLSLIAIGGGTSFSGPLIAGAVASLWSANRNLTNREIVRLVRGSATNYKSPDDTYGYGLADMRQALSPTNITNPIEETYQLKIYPNPVVNSQFSIHNVQLTDGDIIEIYNINGQRQYNTNFTMLNVEPGSQKAEDGEAEFRPSSTVYCLVNCELKSGIYTLRVISNNKSHSIKFIKQ